MWWWNRYPGARVDSPYPVYQFTDKELWKDWTFEERFPGREEILRYFQHVEHKWELKKNTRYNSTVTSAEFDEVDNKWTVMCQDGSQIRSRWFIPTLGFAAKKYIPPFKGMTLFEGSCFHSALWPQTETDVKGKRVAVIGSGASGVQIIQDIAGDVKHMTVFQRTPNSPVPMRQQKLTKVFQDTQKADGTYEEVLHRAKYQTWGGFDMKPVDRKYADDTPEQRRKIYEEVWEKGGFNIIAAGYQEALMDEKANADVWRFWAEKQGARVKDFRKRAILCPPEPPYPFGSKRIPLEQHYFEVFNQDNVDLIDINTSPILEFTKTGIQTEKDGHMEFDIIVLATGFDAVTGGLTDLGVKGTDGMDLKERWKDEGIYTNLGMTCNKYPNMFFFYGPQAPCGFSNGPTSAELQGEWTANVINDMRSMGKTRIEAIREAEEGWRKGTNDIWQMMIFSKCSHNWYSGANIPGKKVEAYQW